MKDFGEGPAHLLSHNMRLIRVLVVVPALMGESLRHIVDSPNGRWGKSAGHASKSLYPLPLDEQCASGLRTLFHYSACSKIRTRTLWEFCTEAWNGLLILGLNGASGHKTELVGAPNRFQKKVLAGLSVDCLRLVFRSFKPGQTEMFKGPEVPWGARLPSMSVSYSGEIVDKAKWLTFAQVLPGLPPLG